MEGGRSTRRDAIFLIIKTEREAGTRDRERAGGVVGGKESVTGRKYESESKYSRKYEKIGNEMQREREKERERERERRVEEWKSERRVESRHESAAPGARRPSPTQEACLLLLLDNKASKCVYACICMY